jgi:hypothetical protein
MLTGHSFSTASHVIDFACLTMLTEMETALYKPGYAPPPSSGDRHATDHFPADAMGCCTRLS